MQKRLILLWAVALLFAGTPLWAAEGGAMDLAAKKSAILRLFEAQPPRTLVDASIMAVADNRYGQNDPARDEFVSRLQLAVDYDAIEAATLAAMTELYSLQELNHMADYYTSELGRSAEAKTQALREKIAPKLQIMLDQALMDVITSPSPAQSVGQNR
jgi:hypothetical protein